MATPILDVAVHAACTVQELGYTDDAERRVTAALRAALPWEPSSEQLEAMRDAIMSCDEESAWDSIASADCRKAALAAYRAQPIMRELYPEQFR